MAEERTFIVVTDQPVFANWLTRSLREFGTVMVAEASSLESVLQLVDVTGTRLVLVSLSRAGLRQEVDFLVGLLSAKPMLPVIAVAETMDQNLMLAALRAGARDFITPELSADEVVSEVRYVLERSQVVKSDNRDQSWVLALVSARPSGEAPMLALHLALAIQQQSPANKVLLLDLGVPTADTLLFLGIQSSYTFIDAVRSLRRLDETLIETAFGAHPSGLRLLAMPEDPNLSGQEITSADVYVLLGTLRRFFTHIVISLGGMPNSEFLFLTVGRADKVVFLVEQSLPSCKQNMVLLQKLRDNKINLDEAGVIIDYYLPKMPPDAESIASGMNLPLIATLPASGMARLAVMNTGRSMFEAAPRDPYATAVRSIAHRLVPGGPAQTAQQATVSWLAALRERFGHGAR
ncbi:Response regulator [Thauera humireducens]|uniref:AAA family ATPase n=1 Tax=Thauera humireducens TaxID=1134435 RepID=UPI002467A33F|nr:pilus assembly protein [Thauera humireducens]CAH1746301.1 Response regulator [Thauera humireducens]